MVGLASASSDTPTATTSFLDRGCLRLLDFLLDIGKRGRLCLFAKDRTHMVGANKLEP
jgi:hypothetical protein